jgi:hypothetical protein
MMSFMSISPIFSTWAWLILLLLILIDRQHWLRLTGLDIGVGHWCRIPTFFKLVSYPLSKYFLLHPNRSSGKAGAENGLACAAHD